MIFSKKNFKIIRSGKSINNYLVTIATGKKYFDNWKKNFLDDWLSYCNYHNLGLIVFDKDLIEKSSVIWKHPTWQRLIVPKILSIYAKQVKNICLLDADIIINPLSPNIFRNFNPKNISVVSLYENLPYNETYKELRKKIVFYRKNFMKKNYPLRSSILGGPEEIYKNYKFSKSFNNYFCAGVILLNINKNSDFFLKTYFKYYNDRRFIGVEVPLNFEIYNKKKVTYLDYKFQAIWLYELANKYSFLYRIRSYKKIKDYCIQQSMLDNYFIHFAGSWPDTKSSKYFKNSINNISFKKLNKNFYNFKKLNLKPLFNSKKINFN